jgi:hypothetical protein
MLAHMRIEADESLRIFYGECQDMAARSSQMANFISGHFTVRHPVISSGRSVYIVALDAACFDVGASRRQRRYFLT